MKRNERELIQSVMISFMIEEDPDDGYAKMDNRTTAVKCGLEIRRSLEIVNS